MPQKMCTIRYFHRPINFKILHDAKFIGDRCYQLRNHFNLSPNQSFVAQRITAQDLKKVQSIIEAENLKYKIHVATDSLMRTIIKNLDNNLFLTYAIWHNDQLADIILLYPAERRNNGVTYQEGYIYMCTTVHISPIDTINTIIPQIRNVYDVLTCTDYGPMTESILKECKFTYGTGRLNVHQFGESQPFTNSDFNLGLLL